MVEQNSVAGVVAEQKVAAVNRILEPPSLCIRRVLDQIRSLAASIRTVGLLEPLIVRPSKREGFYELIAGHRRLAAAKEVGLEHVQVVVRTDLTDDLKALSVAASENSGDARKALAPMDEARLYKRFTDSGLTKAEAAERCGTSEQNVRKTVSLLDLPEEIQSRIEAGKLKKTVGFTLAELNPEVREAVIPQVQDKMAATAIRELANAIAKEKGVDALDKAKTVAGGHASRKEAAVWRGKKAVGKAVADAVVKLDKATNTDAKAFWRGVVAGFFYVSCKLDALSPKSTALKPLLAECRAEAEKVKEQEAKKAEKAKKAKKAKAKKGEKAKAA